MKLFNKLSILAFGMMLLVAGCAESGDYDDDEMENEDMEMSEGQMGQDTTMHENEMDVTMAIATINPTAGNEVKGTVRFDGSGNGVRVNASFSGLPEGPHGFHVHLYGDCSADDGTSAGTHYNFDGSSQNPPSDIDRITGNLGNATADASGNATADTTISNTSLHDILGRAVIVHANANDPSQPPIGAAGARLGCGVIGIAQADADMNTSEGMDDENM